MKSLSVIKNFNVFEYGGSGFLARLKSSVPFFSMENKKYHNEKYKFRILNVSKVVITRFIDEFGNFALGHTVAPYFKNKKYVISMPWSSKIPLASLLKFIEKNKLSNYGISCYLTTNRDNDGISVPKGITSFYKKIGGMLDFSFIFVDE